jgi:5-methylcytosine-specific restriction endonuclease McrA
MDFYQSEKWRRKRAAILRRDGYMCQECKRYGRARQAVHVHHIVHLEDAPELAFADENLVSLCLACHNKKHPEKGGNYRH